MIIFIILTWKIWLQHLQNVFVKNIALIRQILKEKEIGMVTFLQQVPANNQKYFQTFFFQNLTFGV